MTLEHVGQGQDLFREPTVVFRVFDSNPYERSDVFAELSPVDSCRITGDEPFLLELAHSLGYGWLGQAYGCGHFKLSYSSIALQEIQELIIYRVEGHMTKIITAILQPDL